MFGLAIEYLLDKKGLGKTHVDMKTMLEEMALGTGSETSFETHIGLSAPYFREHFYDLICDFLTVH